eukprot:TRINITY_DN19904_c0_g1_i1.p1 TRINITY_DN19904_c0_g1~~TRINITY_DN19904_c0_g1_i1.p1  ORF type:complete len:339 (+),score=90.96 TRINITY_DN19904_c0_g1_i1:107-1123(+)
MAIVETLIAIILTPYYFVHNLTKRQIEAYVIFGWLMLMPLSILWNLFVKLNPLMWPYWLWMTYDAAPANGGRIIQAARALKIWNYFTSYFPVSIKKEADLPTDTNYLLLAHPHGILPMGLFANFATESTGISKLFPGITFHLCTLESNFSRPILRDIMMAMAHVPVSEVSIKYLLNDKKLCHGVIDVIGGSAESLDQKPGTARLTLNKRSGAFRIALELGIPMVPIFSFGENEVYMQVENPRGSLLRTFQEFGKKVMGMSPTLFYGSNIAGTTWGFLPYRKPITTVVGAPLHVDKIENPSDEDIDRLRERYVTALTALWDKYKDVYAKDRKEELSIVA